MGGGSGSTQTTGPSFSVQNSSPWGPQQNYLLNAWQDAQNNYNKQSSTPYNGQFAAGPTSQQYDAYGNAYNNANNQQGYVNSQLGTGQNATNAGVGATSSAIGNMGAFAQGNNPANLTNQASQIASGYNVPAEVAAATEMANRNAAENTIPNLYRGAAAGGNINGSQAALAQGVVNRGLDENAQNLAATLENQNYTQGLNSASNENQLNMAALQGAGALGLGLGGIGNNATNSGFANQTNLNQQATGGANGVQNLNQLTNTSNLQNYLGPQSLQNQQLASLYSIIGSNNWGGQTTSMNSGNTSTTQQNPSMMSTVGSGLGAAGSIFGNGGSNGGLVGGLSGLQSILGSFI